MLQEFEARGDRWVILIECRPRHDGIEIRGLSGDRLGAFERFAYLRHRVQL